MFALLLMRKYWLSLTKRADIAAFTLFTPPFASSATNQVTASFPSKDTDWSGHTATCWKWLRWIVSKIVLWDSSVRTSSVSRDYNQRWLLGEQSLIFSIYHIPLLVHFNAVHVLALINPTRLHQNSRRTLNSAHRSVFINLDASVGGHRISRQVSARGRSFKISADLSCSLSREERGEIIDHSSNVDVQKDGQRLRDLQLES